VKLAGGESKMTVTDNTTTCDNNVKITTNTIERKKEQRYAGPITKRRIQ